MGPVKIVADLWCNLSKPVRKGHFFNRKIFSTIGLWEKSKKMLKISQNTEICSLGKFCFFRFFLNMVSPIDLIIFLLKKRPSRTGFDGSHHRSATILTGPFFCGFGFSWKDATQFLDKLETWPKRQNSPNDQKITNPRGSSLGEHLVAKRLTLVIESFG